MGCRFSYCIQYILVSRIWQLDNGVHQLTQLFQNIHVCVQFCECKVWGGVYFNLQHVGVDRAPSVPTNKPAEQLKAPVGRPTERAKLGQSYAMTFYHDLL